MSPQKDPFEKLKQKAEEILEKKEDGQLDIQGMEMETIIHDLQVHHVELKLQNIELLRAMEELEIAKEQYSQLFEQAPVGYISVDPQGIIHKANQAFQNMIGLPLPQLTRRPFVQFIPEKDHSLFLGVFKKFIAHKEGQSLDVRLASPSQKPIEALLNIKAPDSRSTLAKESILITISDVTQKKAYEQALRESKDKLNTIIEDLPAMVCRFNPRGIISFCNSEFNHHFKIFPTRGKPHNFFDILPENQRDSIQKEFISLTPNHPVKTMEIPFSFSPKEKRWQRWTIRTIFNDEGRAVTYQTVGQDITEEVRIMEENKEKERLQSLVELSGAVCHELRQPLQILMGYVELISMDLKKNETPKKGVNQLKEQIHRVNTALNQLEHITQYKTKAYTKETQILDLEKSCDRRAHDRYIPTTPLSVEFIAPSKGVRKVLNISKGGLAFDPPLKTDHPRHICSIKDSAQNIMVDRLAGEIDSHRIQFMDLTPSQLLHVNQLIARVKSP